MVNLIKNIENTSMNIDEFNELFNFLETSNIHWIGVFPYYREKGTAAALSPPLDNEIVMNRYRSICQLQQKKIKEINAKRVGSSFKTLIHARNGDYVGHTEFAAPEIDSNVISLQPNVELGEFYNLTITHTKNCDLYGKIA